MPNGRLEIIRDPTPPSPDYLTAIRAAFHEEIKAEKPPPEATIEKLTCELAAVLSFKRAKPLTVSGLHKAVDTILREAPEQIELLRQRRSITAARLAGAYTQLLEAAKTVPQLVGKASHSHNANPYHPDWKLAFRKVEEALLSQRHPVGIREESPAVKVTLESCARLGSRVQSIH